MFLYNLKGLDVDTRKTNKYVLTYDNHKEMLLMIIKFNNSLFVSSRIIQWLSIFICSSCYFLPYIFVKCVNHFYDKWRVKLLCTNIYSTLYQISLLYSLTWKTKIKINCRQLFSNFIINVGTPFMKISFLELIFISKLMIFVVENLYFKDLKNIT